MKKYVEGQKVWFVPSTGILLQKCELTIHHVGNRWAECSHSLRFDVNTRIAYSARGEHWYGNVFDSQAEYEDKLARDQAFSDLVGKLRYMATPPSLEAIKQAAEILGVKI